MTNRITKNMFLMLSVSLGGSRPPDPPERVTPEWVFTPGSWDYRRTRVPGIRGPSDRRSMDVDTSHVPRSEGDLHQRPYVAALWFPGAPGAPGACRGRPKIGQRPGAGFIYLSSLRSAQLHAPDEGWVAEGYEARCNMARRSTPLHAGGRAGCPPARAKMLATLGVSLGSHYCVT